MKQEVIMARNDQEAKANLIKKFDPLIKKCVRMYIHDLNLYEDGLQEGYITVAKCINNYDLKSECGFEGYVKASVIYNIRQFSRKQPVLISLDEEFNDDGGTLLETLAGDKTTEDIIDIRCNNEVLIKALKKLKPSDLEIIYSIYFKNLKMTQICNGPRSKYVYLQRRKTRILEKLKLEIEQSR